MVDTLHLELPPGGISLEGIEKFFQGPAKHLDISRKALRSNRKIRYCKERP